MGSTLFIVATPIGNLGDLNKRARETLASVDLIAAEDTRHSRRLLDHSGITTHMVSLHEHNEASRVPELMERLADGQSLALISDAGTPLISDPGFRLVRAASAAGHKVSPIPGPCAAVAALSVAGLPTDRFLVEGFLPARSGPRRKRLAALAAETATLIFYVAPHRLCDELADLAMALDGTRQAVVARELTKLHECVYRGSLESLLAQARADENMRRGELVILVAGAESEQDPGETELERMLSVLLAQLSPRTAAAVLADLTGCKRNKAYKLALRIADKHDAGN